MRQLLPDLLDDPDVDALYAGDERPAPVDRPWVVSNMISSIDGAAALDGVSGGLGGPGDKAVFSALRSVADVVLAAAGTVRAERYRPPRTTPAQQARRVARGQEPFPRIAVISGRLNLDYGAPLFGPDSPTRPIIITGTGPSPEQLARASEVAEVIVADADLVDVGDALRRLGDLGARVVLCEGGPSLNGQLVADDLIDESCLTISPLLAGGDAGRIMQGAPVAGARPMRLARVLAEGDMLMLRYLRA
ncbi:MAG: dihydrofolate reductase family protein [Acidimicrobiales bacterium]